jgi:hypothetical protein
VYRHDRSREVEQYADYQFFQATISQAEQCLAPDEGGKDAAENEKDNRECSP